MLEEGKKNVKIILLGDAGVGKSSIILRYNEDSFKENIDSTFDSNFIEKKVTIKGHNINLELWDTAGQEQYRSVTKIFVKNSKIILLVYDITSKKSFDSLNYWHDFINKELGSNVILGLIGNKTDLIFEDNYKEEVSSLEAKEYANKIGAAFSLFSAKESSIELKELIDKLLIKYLDLNENTRYLSSTIKIDERSFTREINVKYECCLSKSSKGIKLIATFLGDNGVGKTALIKALKGKEGITNLPHTKKKYKEKMHYMKNGLNIIVKLKELNYDEFLEHNADINNQGYNFYFLIFDVYKKDSFLKLENLVELINKNEKIYLIGYNNDISENKISQFNYIDEVEKFAKLYKCEYEYITLDDIYKIKAIIIDNIGFYLSKLGY